jgi:acetyl-CoA carboxylase biotin carboxylase subunit
MYEGWAVPIDYDPLLAKLVGYGTDREQVIARLQRALYEYFVGGIKTNISLFRRILADKDFRAGKVDTSFLDNLLAEAPEPPERAEEKARVAAVAANGAAANGAAAKAAGSPWKQAARLDALRTR